MGAVRAASVRIACENLEAARDPAASAHNSAIAGSTTMAHAHNSAIHVFPHRKLSCTLIANSATQNVLFHILLTCAATQTQR